MGFRGSTRSMYCLLSMYGVGMCIDRGSANESFHDGRGLGF